MTELNVQITPEDMSQVIQSDPLTGQRVVNAALTRMIQERDKRIEELEEQINKSNGSKEPSVIAETVSEG
jgi:Arc/MetJ family transcription regulator